MLCIAHLLEEVLMWIFHFVFSQQLNVPVSFYLLFFVLIFVVPILDEKCTIRFGILEENFRIIFFLKQEKYLWLDSHMAESLFDCSLWDCHFWITFAVFVHNCCFLFYSYEME